MQATNVPKKDHLVVPTETPDAMLYEVPDSLHGNRYVTKSRGGRVVAWMVIAAVIATASSVAGAVF